MDNNRTILNHYVTNLTGNVFALKNLPEEVAAVLFAYYSRSADGVRENLLKLLGEGDLAVSTPLGDGGDCDAETQLADAQDKARAFHEKWVVGYGHGSVAEHAVVKLALENVSILSSKIIEDCRLASYTEKSTRYVAFDPSKAIYPESVMSSPVADVYRDAIKRQMNAYIDWMEPVIADIKRRVPKAEKQTPRSYDAACKSTACDTLRYLLPAATHTNIGVTVNARSLEAMISKLLSQALPEARTLGEQIKAEAVKVVPTLLKYADRNEYRAAAIGDTPRIISSALAVPPGQSGVRVLQPYVTEAQALALIGLPGGPVSPATALAERGKHDPAPREFERVSLTFEIVMDYGAYRDVQRHRMATMATDPLSPAFGFERPRDIAAFGLEAQFDRLMEQAQEAYSIISKAGFSVEASYVLPLAYRVRTLFTANIRELFHFIELRSSRQGHPSYRKIAQQVWDETNKVYPLIAEHIRVNRSQYLLTRD
ncbi:MAG TPA: FAD-dependent thymidylate synthase [Capsulimonadaceae bacterium]|jgi:thymidylate synthase ThyX